MRLQPYLSGGYQLDCLNLQHLPLRYLVIQELSLVPDAEEPIQTPAAPQQAAENQPTAQNRTAYQVFQMLHAILLSYS